MFPACECESTDLNIHYMFFEYLEDLEEVNYDFCYQRFCANNFNNVVSSWAAIMARPSYRNLRLSFISSSCIFGRLYNYRTGEVLNISNHFKRGFRNKCSVF